MASWNPPETGNLLPMALSCGLEMGCLREVRNRMGANRGPGGSLHEPVGLPVRPSARPAASPPFLPPREGAITFSPDVTHVTNALLAPG